MRPLRSKVSQRKEVKDLKSQIKYLAELAEQYQQWYTNLQESEYPISDQEAFKASDRKEKEEITDALDYSSQNKRSSERFSYAQKETIS